MLAKYVGWGGLSGAFRNNQQKFSTGLEEVGKRLEDILTPEEHATARRSTQYAHYTAEHVIRSMWSAVRKMGFEGGSVFEPGMGIGHFFGMMPPDVAARSQYQGIEMDALTADIAKLLYPQSGVREADFTQTPIPDNTFDLVIGNPPFSDTVIKADPKYAPRNFMLHDYFFAKSIDALRPGGLLAFVTSAGTMNKIDAGARHYLAQRAEFLGGVRLPSTAFKKNAGTEVTADILFFKKRDEPISKMDAAGETWTATQTRDLPTPEGGTGKAAVSTYFTKHPEQVLGREGLFDKLYKGRYAVHAPEGADLEAELDKALDRLPKDVYTALASPEGKAELDLLSTERKDGSFYVQDGKLMQYSGGAGRPVPMRGAGVEGGLTGPDRERVTRLIPVRDALRDVFAADLAEDGPAAASAREKLNTAYDGFVRKFGPINKADYQYRRPTIIQQESARAEEREAAIDRGESWVEGDFNATSMYDEGKSITEIAKARNAARERARAEGKPFNEGSFAPEEMPDVVLERLTNIAPFMDDPESYRLRAIEQYDSDTGKATKKRVFFESVLTRETEPDIRSAQDGVLWSLNKFGRLDIDKIAEKRGQNSEAVVAELGDSVFLVPGTHSTYAMADEYLSGDVVDKLLTAKNHAQRDKQFQRNVQALEAAIPPPLPPSQITMNLGMPWIPVPSLTAFVRDHLELGAVRIKRSKALGGWSVTVATQGNGFPRWGTAHLTATRIVTEALNKTKPRVYTRDAATEPGKTAFDAVATQAAADKIDAVSAEFQNWLGQDPQRKDDLANAYNDILNRTALRQFDGAYLTTPGISAEWRWRPHQRRVVARIILTGNTYVAHAVGAGKTSEYIGAGMEMRRLGLINKPMYAVPNHMLGQFTKEFYEQYPLAQIMVADERRFHTSRRKQFMANVAQSDIDAVIITHSSFGKIPLSYESQKKIVDEQVAELREALSDLDKQSDRITIKKIESQIEKLEQRLTGAFTSRKDKTNTFEEMGIDFLFVDEAHEFRKLDFASRQNIKGITTEGSQRAFDLYSKIRHLETKRPGRSVVMGSGTPITNTMGELFTLQRYMQLPALQRHGLAHFDSWASAFGETKTETEPTPQGTYERVTRFSAFVNAYELYKMVGEVMDIVTPGQLDQYVVRPKLKGGKRELHLAEKTPAYEEFQRDLVRRVNEIKARKRPPEPGDDILLSVINDGRHAAIDMRYVGEHQNDPKSKLNQMIDAAFGIWQRTKDVKFFDPGSNYQKEIARGPATQMIFSNLGVNGRGPMDFGGYEWIKRELVRRGVPKNEIAFIKDYKTHVAKQRLFNDMNAGRIRFLVGSTQKMGTGVNAQRRLYATHNLDPLWFPADDEQRVGRILRQGNLNPEIQVHDYATEGTYDEQMWKMMGRKGRFVEQFFRGDPTLRRMEDIGEAGYYEQASAMAASDPRIIRLTEMNHELQKLERQWAAHDSEQYSMGQKIRYARGEIEYADGKIPQIQADIAQHVPTHGDAFSMIVGDKQFSKRADAEEQFGKDLNAKVETMVKGERQILGELGGFAIAVESYGKDGFGYLWRRTNKKWQELGTSAKTPGGIIRAFEKDFDGLADNVRYLEDDKRRANQTIDSLSPQVGKEFAKKADIARLRVEVGELERAIQPVKPLATVQDVDTALRDAEGALRVGSMSREGYDKRRNELLAKRAELETKPPAAPAASPDQTPPAKTPKASYAIRREPAPLPAGATIEDMSVQDAHRGEMFGSKRVLDPQGHVAAVADLSVLPGEVWIKHVKSHAPRQGYATALIDDLFREFPGERIRVSGMTDDGAKFFRSAFNVDKKGYLTQKEGAPRYALSDTPSPPFYSALTRAVEGVKQDKAHPAQWSGIIDNLPGMKKDEVEWSGIKDWLAQQKGAVSKADVADYLRANQIQIKEVLKTGARDTEKLFPEEIDDWDHIPMSGKEYSDGQPKESSFKHGDAVVTWHWANNGDIQRVSARYGDVDLGDFNDFIEAREVLIRRADMGEEGGATKFGSYTLPGGENYRELLLTLPENKSTIDVRQTSDGAWRLWDSAKNDWMRTEDGKLVPMFHSESQARHVADEYGIGHGNALRDANDAIRAYTEEHPDAVPARDAELARLTAASNAIANERQRNRGAIHGRNFRSGHFDEPNIIAHVRFNERTAERALYSGPHAKATTEDRVLFIEEIQSDWHQQGRRRGYVKPMTPTQEARRRELVDKASSSGRFDLKKLTEDERREYERLGQQAAAASNGVPDAPFKTTWPELAFKRMLRYASENGYDQIAWTTGDQQADRYDLSKHISHLQLEDNASGGIGHANLEGEFSGGQLEAWDHNNKRVIDQWVQDEQQLIELIGKDAADKLLGAAPGRGRKAGLGVRVRSLQGLDLKVGGEGMRGFYDKMLPAFANKYGKKWGAKVGETTIDATRYPGVPMEEEDGTPSAGKATAVHSMDITPAMRESVMGGQPLFQRIQTAGKFLLGSHVALTKIVDLNDGSRLVYSPKFEKGRQKLAEQLEAELKRRNLGDIGVHVADAVLARGDYQHADGMYLAGVITIALDAKDPMSTLDHEILHAVRDLGLYTPDEWSLLEEHAKKHWVPRYRGVLAHYDDQADLIDEAIAYAGQDYAHGKAGDMPPKIRSLLQRLIDFFKTIRDFFGKRGFKDSDDVFARVMSGEIGARARSGAPQAQGSSFAHRKKADALKVADELQQREGRVYSVRGTKDEHGKPYWTVGTDGQKIDADTPLPSALDHHLRNLRTLDPNAPEHPFVDTHENQPGYRAPAARRGPAAPGQGALPLGPGKKGSYAIRQPSPDEPKPAAEGKDYVDQTAEDLADHIRGAPPGTYERALDRLTPTIGAYRYQDPDWIRQNIVGPRTFAELDTLSAKMWEAWKEKTREYQTRLTGLRGEIAPTFLKLDQLGREHVYSVEELRRLTDAGPLVDDGRALVMRNTDTMDATKSKPGETLELSADETKALLERQEMFRHAWTDIMEASARRLGWTGDWGESIDTNLRFIEQARDMARSGAERRHMERVLDVLTAMERQRQQAYVPFMRFGDYYLSVTRKPGVGEDREEGFPRTESFQLAERPPMREFLGGKIVEGVPPDYAKKMIADAQVKFPPDKFRIEHGWLHRKPNILRDLDIPAIEKLFTLMEGGVLDRLKEEESLDGRAEKKAARLAAKSRYDKLYGDMVDALHDQLYQELKAGFKKRARNVPGWGSDFDRVTGSYMNWTARHVAENLHHDNIERAYTEIQDKHPSPPMRLYWRDWKAAQERPSSPVSTIANSVNQVGFMYALAFNPSSTFLVALHGPLFAIPTMSKGIGIGAAAVEFGHAYREGLPAMRWDERTGLALDHSAIGRTPEEKAFVQKMLEEGDLHAKGADDIRSLGEHAASLWGHSAPQMRRIMDMASSNIAVADQLNRVAVALGTYRLVRRPGVLKKMDAAWQDNELWRTMAQREGITPENAARFMLGQATGEWGKESRSAWGRTDVGRLFTSLHGFIIKLISNMWKLVRTSLGGRRAFMWTMAALWAGAGIEGLPFVQDVENLLDEIWKTLTGRGNPAEGHDPMLTYRLRALVMDTGLGPLGAEMVMKGPASTLSGIDIASRIGVGDIASRVIGDDIMLTVPAILGNILYGTFINKDYTTALPAGLRNPARAVKMVQHGATSQSGKSVYIPKNKVTPLEAGARALGFQSTQERRARELQDYSFRAKRARGTVPRLPLVNPYKAP